MRQDNNGWRRVKEAALSDSLSNRCLCAIGRCVPSPYVWAPTTGILDRISTATPRTKSSGQVRSKLVSDGSPGGAPVLVVGFVPEPSRPYRVPEQEGPRIVAFWLETFPVLTPITRTPSPKLAEGQHRRQEMSTQPRSKNTCIKGSSPIYLWLPPCCDPPKAGSPHAVPCK